MPKRTTSLLNLVGQKFSRLLVIDKAPNVGNRTCWNCLCDCGVQKTIAAQSLIMGLTKSCGCLRRERVSEGKRKSQGASGLTSLFTSYRKRAKEHNRPMTLTREEFEELTRRNCSYCGDAPSSVRTLKRWKGRQIEAAVRAQQHSAYIYNGLDRLDSSLGYTKENSVACCTKCNRAKNDMPVSEFREHVTKMFTHLCGRNNQQ